MKKNGFTLVELLAVIAILAILVIIALPNVMGMFNQAKKNSFTTEIKEVYKVAQQTWISDSMFETSEKEYSRCSTCTGKSLDLSGRSELDYYIKFDKAGNVIKYYATDGTYQYKYDSPVGLLVENITSVDSVADLSDSEKLVISSNGGNGGASASAPVSFATDSWVTIINAVVENNTSAYNVGDTKQVDLGSLGVHTVRIANKAEPSICSTTGFSQTACGFVVEFTDIISDYQLLINSYDSNVGGWEASSMRAYVNSTIYNALPSDLKDGIRNTYVVSGYGSSDDTNFATIDRLYLLAAKEVWATNESDLSDTATSETRQLDYYNNIGVTISNNSNAKKYKNGTAETWSLRTPCRGDNDGWYGVRPNGNWIIIGGNDSLGVSPAFRIGYAS